MACGDRRRAGNRETEGAGRIRHELSAMEHRPQSSRHGIPAGSHGCPRSVSGGLRATCLTAWTGPNPIVAGRRELRYQILAAAASLLRHRLLPEDPDVQRNYPARCRSAPPRASTASSRRSPSAVGRGGRSGRHAAGCRRPRNHRRLRCFFIAVFTMEIGYQPMKGRRLH